MGIGIDSEKIMETIKRSRKEVGEWKQVKDDVQDLLNVEQKLILRYLLSLFWLLSNQPL